MTQLKDDSSPSIQGRSKEEILMKHLNDHHKNHSEDLRSVLLINFPAKAVYAAMEEYSQQSAGREWISVEDYKGEQGRLIVYSPLYKESDPMRFRVIDAQFLSTCKDVTHYAPPTPPQK